MRGMKAKRVTKKGLFEQEQKHKLELSKAVTQQRIARSGLDSIKSADPDLRLFNDVLQSPLVKGRPKLPGVKANSVKKLVGA